MKSLMLKMMVVFGSMIIAVCTVFLVFSVNVSSKNLREIGEEGFLALRDSWSIAISGAVEAEQYLLETIARQASLTNEALTMEQRLSGLQVDLTAGKEIGYLNFGLILPDGTLYSTDGTIQNVAGAEYFKIAMKGKNYYSDPFKSNSITNLNELITVSAVPIFKNNIPAGVLVAEKDGYFFAEFTTELAENVTGTGVIFSLTDGTTVGALDYSLIGSSFIEMAKTNPALAGLASVPLALMRGEIGTTEYTSSTGLERIGFYAPIAGTPWGLLVSQDIREVEARSRNFFVVMVIFSIIMLSLALAITYLIARNISLPIKYATEQIQYLSEGDLSFENKLQFYRTQKNEIGTISRSLHTLQESVSNVFRDIISAAQQVADGSQQISSSSQSVSSVASEQAAATEEVSATMEEMASNIKQNADNAVKTGSISKQAVENAHVGQQAVNEALEAVRKIATEVSVVSGIASQINLLALNAAIEAARAGDAGKGFAVVASEVRKLAEKSQIAATEINGLSTKTIVVAERADEVISSVIPRIEETASLIEEISFASKEQDTGAQQVNKAIVQMDVGVQQNASSSEELASMAEELSSQAMQLIDILRFFKLAEESDQNTASSQRPTQRTTTIPKTMPKQERQKPPRKVASSNGIGTQSYTSTSNANDFEEF